MGVELSTISVSSYESCQFHVRILLNIAKHMKRNVLLGKKQIHKIKHRACSIDSVEVFFWIYLLTFVANRFGARYFACLTRIEFAWWTVSAHV